MNILTISTLNDKGGAAYIANILQNGLQLVGYETKYLVGYGKKGLKQKTSEKEIIFSDYLLPIFPHLNFISHRIIGKDIFSPKENQLNKLIDWADVIICHTLHSHFINYQVLFGIFKEVGLYKKIIMVAHDSWNYTGRCAFIYDCDNWQNSCIKCPNKDFYPSTKISISNFEFKNKIKLTKLIPNLQFVSPANWICEDLKKIYPEIPVHLIRNGIDTKPYQNIKIKRRNNKEVEFCVSSVSLSQAGKVDLKLVKDILDFGLKVHFIGKDNPFSSHPNAITHGYVTDRDVYLEILNNVDCYLFTSTIDIYPTVLVDALCSGCFIIYTKSKGALEVMESEYQWPGKCVSSVNDIVQYVESEFFIDFIDNIANREKVRELALEFFSVQRMVTDYNKLIKTI